MIVAGAAREGRAALVLLIGTMLLASGVRLSENPALAAAARAVRSQPLEHAAAAASWAAQALWSGPAPERVARMGCDHDERRWQ
ncbi:MAG TPA: hypothetical protein VFN91_08135 [Myxococcaceae bacterium]|nr:hypothetical protein [Myxococcaceae bacterium]